MRSFLLQRIGIESTGAMVQGLSALHATSKGHGPRGHDSDKQDRRRRAERPCCLCRPADRDAAKPGRHDRISAGSEGLPEDGGERQAYRPADDPQHDRSPRWPARSTAASPACSSSVRWPRGDLILPLIATRSWSASIPRPPLPELCRTRSVIRDDAAIVDELAPNRRPQFDRPYRCHSYGRGELERLRSEAASLCGVSSGSGVGRTANAQSCRRSRRHARCISSPGTGIRTKDYVARRLRCWHSTLFEP